MPYRPELDVQPTGGDGFTPYNTSIPLPSGILTKVASTGALPAGTYYVTATALMFLPGGGEGLCYVTTGSNPTGFLATGGSDNTSMQQAAETVAVSVTAGDTLQEWCETGDQSGTPTSLYAGITAIRILSSSGTSPATAGARASHHRPARHGR